MLKAGIQNVGSNLTTDNRLRVSLQDNGVDYHWYNRTFLKKDKYKFGFLSCYDIGKKVLQKNHLLLTYTHNDQHSLYLRT